jgi:hypothetical protein
LSQSKNFVKVPFTSETALKVPVKVADRFLPIKIFTSEMSRKSRLDSADSEEQQNLTLNKSKGDERLQAATSSIDAKLILTENSDEPDNKKKKNASIKTDKKNDNSNNNITPNIPLIIQSATLHDLCDSSFVRKNKLVKKKSKNQEYRSIVIGNSKAGGNNNDKTGSSNTSNKPPQPPIVQSPPPSAANTLGANDVPKVGPQVEFINGKIMIRESSLVVNYDNAANTQEYEEVTEGIYPTATYASFLNRRPTPVWTIDETKLFYTCLQRCGTEFSVMQTFFPNRTRKQLKRKFYKEEREHPLLVQKALYTSLPLPVDIFEAKYKIDDNQDDPTKNESTESLTAPEKNDNENSSNSTSNISTTITTNENNKKNDQNKITTKTIQYEPDSDGWLDL